MRLEELYNKFVAWVDGKATKLKLLDNAPQEAKEAYDEFMRIKYKKKGTIVE